jgi:hypothetical protein
MNDQWTYAFRLQWTCTRTEKRPVINPLTYPGSRVQTRPKPSDFFGRKNPQHAFLRKGSKAVGPVSKICGTLKNTCDYMEVASKAKFVGHFSPQLSSYVNRGLRARAARGSTEGSLVQHGRPLSWRRKLNERRTKGQCNTGLVAYGAIRPQYQSTIYHLTL